MNFTEFAGYLQLIAESKVRSHQAELLAELLTVLNVVELAPAVYLCQGRLAEPYYPREIDHIRLTEGEIIRILEKIGSDTHSRGVRSPESPTDQSLSSLSNLYYLLHSHISQIDAWLSKQQQIPSWLSSCAGHMQAIERQWLAKIIRGSIVKDELIIAALTKMAPPTIGTRQALNRTYKQTLPDLGLLATLFVETGLDYWTLEELKLQVGIPIKPQEISRWDSAAETYKALGPCSVQPKCNGWQLQIHKKDQEIYLYNRGLQTWNGYLPDVVEACRQQLLATTAILDSEVVGYDSKTKQVLPREQTLLVVEHRVLVFDLLFVDGEDWRKQPYYARRQRLLQLLPVNTNRVLTTVEEEKANNTDELNHLYERWSHHPDYEGIVAIALNSPYLANSKTKQKGKLKSYYSLETVIIGFSVSAKGTPSFLVGVRDGSKIAQVGFVEGTITSPQVRDELLTKCRLLKTSTKPVAVISDVVPQCWVQPRLIIEVTVAGKIASRRFLHVGYELYRKINLQSRPDIRSIQEDVDDVEEFMSFPNPPGSVEGNQ